MTWTVLIQYDVDDYVVDSTGFGYGSHMAVFWSRSQLYVAQGCEASRIALDC